jgi:hypothetical protein
MALIAFNGSPRGKNSNSSVIIDWYLEDRDTPVYFLNRINHHQEYISMIPEYDEMLIVFPLYVDGMPAQVKLFFEQMDPIRDKVNGIHVTWIIHSGFSEAVHCSTLKKYLELFSKKINFASARVIIIPGSEGFRLMPPQMLKKKSRAVSRLAKGSSDKDIKYLEGREKIGLAWKAGFFILSKFGLTNMYWDRQLKSNDIFEKRFDAPYRRQ